MNYIFREATKSDKEFIINANKEINVLSGLDDSTFEKNEVLLVGLEKYIVGILMVN